VELLQTLYVTISTVLPTKFNMVVEWLDVVGATGFFSENLSKFSSGARQTIFNLCVLLTIGFLDLDQDFSIEGAYEHSYILDPSTLIKAHGILGVKYKMHSPACPALLAWGLVLHRVSIRLSEEPKSSFDSLLVSVLPQCRKVTDDSRFEYIHALGQYSGELVAHALKSGAFDKLSAVFKQLPEKAEYASVGSALVAACLPYVSMTDSLAQLIHTILAPFPYITDNFFTDAFAEKAFFLSKAKFPVAFDPFVTLCTCIRENAFDVLMRMTAYMHDLPKGFKGYDFTGKSTQIELTSPLIMFPARTSDGQGGVTLEAGTKGDLVSSGSGRTLVMWQLEYNGWSFLGRFIEQADAHRLWDQCTMGVVRLITNTLNSLDESQSAELLESLSAGIANADFVEFIAKKLDEALYNRNIEMCIIGIKLLTALVSVDPQRVWPYLGRSKLLEKNGRGGLLATILGAVEIVSSNYEFTIAIIELAQALVKDTLARALEHSISAKVKQEVLTKLIRHLVEVYESFAYWRYAVPRQRITIATSILSVFNVIVHATFRADGDGLLADKVTSVLAGASNLITGEFLGANENAIRTLQPLLGAIESMAKSRDALDSTDNLLEDDEFKYAEATLRFCSLLVRVRSLLKLACSLLERRLYLQSPDLVVIFLRYFRLHSPVADVLESLITGYWPEDQPSLLAHLGTKYSQMLITCLAGCVSGRLETDDTVQNVCSYFSAVIGSKQEGLSILLLSGKDTRNTSDKVESVVSLLDVLEKKVVSGFKIKGLLNVELTNDLLDALALAHSTWSLNVAKNKEALCGALTEFITDAYSLKIPPKSPDEIIDASTVISVAAKAARIMSIQLYKVPESDGSKIFVDFLLKSRNLCEYSKRFLAIDGFRPSLHGNLGRNFDRKWPKTPLDKYIATAQLGRRAYGPTYFYDLGLLDVVLDDEPIWMDGYRNEVAEANLNLSYMDAQISLVKSWCSMLTSLVVNRSKVRDKGTLEMLRIVAGTAVETNVSDDLSVPIFRIVIKARMDLAFFILYHVSKASIPVGDVDLLTTTVKVLTDPNIQFLTFAEDRSGGSDTRLYKQLLKIINLQLDDFAKDDEGDFHLVQALHSILDVVVIRGMRAVASAMQTNPSAGGVEDVVQITTILRKCLKIEGVTSIYPNLVQQMGDSGCDHAVLSLFSNSLELCISEGDPIFGELSLIYLLEWLNVDIMADHFAASGLFGVLTESSLARAIQEGTIRPTTDPRVFGIWTKGILSIMLQFLKQLGSRLLPESIVFIELYSRQFDSAFRQWLDSDVIVSSSTIEETYQLFLLLDIVGKLAESHQLQPKIKLPSKRDVIDSLGYLLSHQKYLASRIVVTTAEEQKLMLQKPQDSSVSNPLLDKVIDELLELKEFLDDSIND
jgi:nuclear pore complex protein Nup188